MVSAATKSIDLHVHIMYIAINVNHGFTQWPLYFTTLNFKTTLTITPLSLAPKSVFVCYRYFILKPPER